MIHRLFHRIKRISKPLQHKKSTTSHHNEDWQYPLGQDQNLQNMLANYAMHKLQMMKMINGQASQYIDWDDDIHWPDDWLEINWYYLVSRLHGGNEDNVIAHYHYSKYIPKLLPDNPTPTHRIFVNHKNKSHFLQDIVFKHEEHYHQCYVQISQIRGSYKPPLSFLIPFEQVTFTIKSIEKNQ